MKETAVSAVPVAEGSDALKVVETSLDRPRSQGDLEARALDQDLRPDVVVAVPQLHSRPDVVEKKSKKLPLGRVVPKFKVKSGTRRYVKETKV